MIRTQIQLTEEQAEGLKQLAARRGVSMAALVRESVDRLLDADDYEARWRRAMSAVGKFRGDGANVGEEHDKYLEEAYLDSRSS